MIAPSIQIETARLEQSINSYVQLSGMTIVDALRKQGGKFAYILAQMLKQLPVAKGKIREERLAALKQGQGVHVRQSVMDRVMQKYGAASRLSDRKVVIGKRKKGTIRTKGRNLNLQALAVQAELNTRESGRGFVSASSRFPVSMKIGTVASKSKFGPLLAAAGFSVQPNSAAVSYIWGKLGPLSTSAATGLAKPRAQKMVAEALAKTTEDIMVYVDRKIAEGFRLSGLT